MGTPRHLDDAVARIAAVTEARMWLGTPYRHRAGLRGVGCDCVFLLVRVFERLGVLSSSFQVPRYQSGLASLRRGEVLYRSIIEQFASLEPERGPQGSTHPLPGDIVLFRFVHATHGAIVENWPTVIHAHLPKHKVVRDSMRDPYLLKRWETTYSPIYRRTHVRRIEASLAG